VFLLEKSEEIKKELAEAVAMNTVFLPFDEVCRLNQSNDMNEGGCLPQLFREPKIFGKDVDGRLAEMIC
jgi:hypothetical protein